MIQCNKRVRVDNAGEMRRVLMCTNQTLVMKGENQGTSASHALTLKITPRSSQTCSKTPFKHTHTHTLDTTHTRARERISPLLLGFILDVGK